MNASDEGNNPWKNNPWLNTNPCENTQRKKGKGRTKLPMEKIGKESNLQVTFSKRRGGVFKKVSEISSLCGAETAVVIFSPGDRPYSFGHPDVETVANRFLDANYTAPGPGYLDPLFVAQAEALIRKRGQQIAALEVQIEVEKQRRAELMNIRRMIPPNLERLSYEQLKQLKKTVLGFKREFDAKVNNAPSMGNVDPNPDEGMGSWGVQGTTPSTGKLPMGPDLNGLDDQLSFFDFGSIDPFGFDAGVENPGNPSSSFLDLMLGNHEDGASTSNGEGDGGDPMEAPANVCNDEFDNPGRGDF